jgi:hypothetical protein
MTDELFQAYKAKASELLEAKVPFGEHQRRAFEIIVGAEIERLKGEITELTKHVQLGPEHKKDPIWAMIKTEMANQGYRNGYDQAMEKSHQLLDRMQKHSAELEQLLGEALRNGYFDQATCSASWLAEVRKAVQ